MSGHTFGPRCPRWAWDGNRGSGKRDTGDSGTFGRRRRWHQARKALHGCDDTGGRSWRFLEFGERSFLVSYRTSKKGSVFLSWRALTPTLLPLVGEGGCVWTDSFGRACGVLGPRPGPSRRVVRGGVRA